MQQFIKNQKFEMLGSVICIALGMLSGYIVSAGVGNLNKPTFNPPRWVLSLSGVSYIL